MTTSHAHQAWLAALLVAALASPTKAAPPTFQEQRALMRQITEQFQSRLEQRQRCIDKATTQADLQVCLRSTGGGWRHGAGMGSGLGDPGLGGPMWCGPMW